MAIRTAEYLKNKLKNGDTREIDYYLDWIDSSVGLLSDNYYTKAQSDARFAPMIHNHDDRYYTKSQSDILFAAAGHSHTHLDITDFNEAAQDAVGAMLTDTSDIDLIYDDVLNNMSAVLTATGVSAGSYGAASYTLQTMVDSKGRIISISSTPISILHSQVSNWNVQVDARITAQKGFANGIAPLDSSAKIDTTYLPDTVLGNLKFKGTLNGVSGLVSSDDPVLNGNVLPAASGANTGYYLIISTGAITVSGTVYNIGDWILSNGSAGWTKVDNSDAVTTVFGRLGNVLANAGDYDTDLVPELIGATNKYYTDERVDDRVSALIQNGTGISWSYNDGLGQLIPTVSLAAFTTDDLIEGINLYVTAAEKALWNTTSSYGDHAGLYYLINDATGVGNADSVSPGFKSTSATFTGSPYIGTDGGNQGYLHTFNWNNGTSYKLQYHYQVNGNPEIRFRRKNSDGAAYWENWMRIWHDGNDGHTSGLDADLLDGQHGSYYYPVSNPAGYITSAALSAYLPLAGGTMDAGSVINLTGSAKLRIGHPYMVFTGNDSGGYNVWGQNIIAKDGSNLEVYTTGGDGYGGLINSYYYGLRYYTATGGVTSGTNVGLGSNYVFEVTKTGAGYFASTLEVGNILYNHNYAYFKNSNGLYWWSGTNAGWHINPEAVELMTLRSAHASASGIHFRSTSGTTLGGFYTTTDDVGLLDGSLNWLFRIRKSDNYLISGYVPVARIPDLATYTGFDARYYTETEIDSLFSTVFSNSYLATREISNADNADGAGVTAYYLNSTSPISPDSALFTLNYSSGYSWQLAGDWRSGLFKVRAQDNTSWTSWLTVWTSGNMGHTSGLNADLLDGYHASDFALVSHTHTTSDITNLSSYTGFDAIYYRESEINNFFDGTTGITGYNKTNWDTAYSYGNHATVGYLLASTAASTYLPLSGGVLTGNITAPNFIRSGGVDTNILLDGGGALAITALTWYDGWVSSPGYNANTIGDNKTGFTYSNNAPYAGNLVHFGSSGYGMQLNSTYNSGGINLAYRTRNGDTNTWNSWYRLWSEYDFTSTNINNWNTSYNNMITSASFSGGNLILNQQDGGTVTASLGTGYIANGVVGDWQIYSETTATDYTTATLELYSAGSFNAPRLSFHWGGTVASQIDVNSAGTIRFLNGVGTDYQNTVANNYYAVNNFINSYSGAGIINSANSNSIFSHSSPYWSVRSGLLYGGLRLEDNTGALKGYYYFDNDGVGLLNSAGSWSVRLNPGTQGGQLYGGWYSTSAFGASYFYDTVGAYNVNLGSGGAEGRGLVAGYSGGAYGGIGYNVRHTTTGGQYIAPSSDTSNYLLFSQGYTFYGAGTGSAGRTLAYDVLATLTNAGDLSIWKKITAGTGYGFYNTNYQAGFNNIWAFASAPGYGIGYKQGGTDHIRIDVSGDLTNTGVAADFEVRPNSAYINNQVVWNAGNDGHTSGLDADLLDGQHGSYYYQASNPAGYITAESLPFVAYGEVSGSGGIFVSDDTGWQNIVGGGNPGPLENFNIDSGGLLYLGEPIIVSIVATVTSRLDSLNTPGSLPYWIYAIAINGSIISSSPQIFNSDGQYATTTVICLCEINTSDLITVQTRAVFGSGNIEQIYFNLKAHKVS